MSSKNGDGPSSPQPALADKGLRLRWLRPWYWLHVLRVIRLFVVPSIPHWLTWTRLRVITESRVVRSSLWWIVAVPVAARVVSSLQEKVTSPGWAVAVVDSLRVPFTWQILFFGAIAFLVAAALFDAFCPGVIQDQKSYGEFRDQGRGLRHLCAYMREVGDQVSIYSPRLDGRQGWVAGNVGMAQREKGDEESFFDVVLQDLTNDQKKKLALMRPSDSLDGLKAFLGSRFHEEKDAYHLLRDAAEQHRPRWRYAAWSLVVLGLVAFGIVFVQNVVWVIASI